MRRSRADGNDVYGQCSNQWGYGVSNCGSCRGHYLSVAFSWSASLRMHARAPPSSAYPVHPLVGDVRITGSGPCTNACSPSPRASRCRGRAGRGLPASRPLLGSSVPVPAYCRVALPLGLTPGTLRSRSQRSRRETSWAMTLRSSCSTAAISRCEMALRAGQACAGEQPGLVLHPRVVPHQLIAAGGKIAHGLLRAPQASAGCGRGRTGR